MEFVIPIFLIIGIIALVYGLKCRRTARLITDTPTTPAGKISTPGFYEVKGKIVAERTVTMPAWATQVVWYTYKVEEKYEYRDRRTNRMRTEWRTLQNQTERCSFKVEDSSGSIWVNPVGAEVDGTSRGHDQSTSSGLLGSLTAPSGGGGILSSVLGGGRSLGQRVTAEYLEPGSSVYALGRVQRESHGLSFVTGGEVFIISNKGEQEVLGRRESAYLAGLIGGGIAIAISLLGLASYLMR